jgi:hypothetical protein
MRSTSGYVVGVGIGLILLSILNHFVFKMDPISHTTKIVFGLGVVVALAGAALIVVGSSKSS